MDYDSYVIEYFTRMELENPRFAWCVAKEIDSAVEYSRSRGLTEDKFREVVAQVYHHLL